MKNKGFVLLVALGLLVICNAAALCVEVNDPNAGAATAEDTASTGALSSDPRLSAKMTYSCKKVAVRNVVGDLMQASNVTLRAGTNTKDWEVRDRKINIFAKETSLRDVMNAIARVTGFKWSIEGTESTPVYRLVWDMKSKQELAALRETIRQTQEQIITDKRKQGLDTINSLDNLNPDQMAKLRAENPFLFWMAASGVGKKFSGFINGAPGLSQALLSGQTLTMNGADLTPAGQSSLGDLLGAVKSLESKFGGRNSGGDVPANLADATITVNAPGRGGRGGGGGGMGRGGPMRGDLLGTIVVTTPSGHTDLPLVNPNSPTTKVFGKVLIEADLLNRPFRDALAESRSELMKAMQQSRNNPGSNAGAAPGAVTTTTIDGQVIVTQLTDPVLDAKVNAKLDAQTLPDIQEQLATAIGIAIVSDNFGGRPGFGGRGGPNMAAGLDTQNSTLRTLLDNLAQRFQYQWGKPSKPIEFQDSDWFNKIESLIPDELIEHWKQTLNKTRTLDISELAQMAGLTQEQFRANVATDDVLSTLNLQQSVMQNRDILQLFTSLSKSQASAAYSGGGFNLKSLGDASTLLKKVLGRNPVLLDNTDAPLILKAIRSKEGANPIVDITISNGDAKTPPATWRITQPNYTPPAKPAG